MGLGPRAPPGSRTDALVLDLAGFAVGLGNLTDSEPRLYCSAFSGLPSRFRDQNVSEPALEPPADLAALRDAIEQLDHQLMVMFRERMRLAEQVADAKLRAAFPFRDLLREEQVLQRARHTARELGLDPSSIEQIYRLIMEAAISHQMAHIRSLPDTPLRIAYQGVEGSFSHLTAQRRYQLRPGGVLLTGYETFRAAAESIRDGSNDLALLPIENSTAGSINETYDLLAAGWLVITAEEITAVAHCLLGLPGARVEELRLVLSHPQALIQCEDFLRALAHVRPQAEFDTAGAARRVKEGHDKTIAAIAGESAARVFGLEILRANIQNQRSNFTRFVEVAREAPPCPTDRPCKTSLLLATGHTPGALGEVLRQFSSRSVNLTKIESRPVPDKPFTYRFYLDIEGHAASPAVSDALRAVRPLAAELRVLGTYPRADPGDLVPTSDGAAPAPAKRPSEDSDGRRAGRRKAPRRETR